MEIFYLCGNREVYGQLIPRAFSVLPKHLREGNNVIEELLIMWMASKHLIM